MARSSAQRSELGVRIADSIRQRGFKSVRDFAKKHQIKYDTLLSLMTTKVKRGRSDTLVAIARGLGLSVEELTDNIAGMADGQHPIAGAETMPADDLSAAAFGEVARRVAAMLAESHLDVGPGQVGEISYRVWAEAQKLSPDMPFIERVEFSLAEARSREIARRSAILTNIKTK